MKIDLQYQQHNDKVIKINITYSNKQYHEFLDQIYQGISVLYFPNNS